MLIRSRIRNITAFIVLLIMLMAVCSCSEKTVEVWRLVKEYDIEGLEFADLEAVAEGFDKEKYFVSVDHETENYDAFMIIMPKDEEYKFVANIKEYSSVADAKKDYQSEIESVGATIYASDSIVRINDMLITGNGFTVKMVLESVGIETHDTVTAPSGSILKRVDGLVPFNKAEKALKEKGYIIYSDEQMMYTIYSPDGSECYLILRFLLPETDERAYEAAKSIYMDADSNLLSGVNVYYCNTYAVRCIGDQWIKLTEGISN